MSIVDAPPRTYATRGGAALAAQPVPRRPPAGQPAPAPDRRGRHLRVVRPADRRRRRLTPAAGIVLTGLLFATLFAIATAHTILVQGQIRLDQLDAQLTVEQARYQALRKDVAEMESPARVVAAASELGMVAPDDLVYLQPEVEHEAAGPGADTPQTPADDAASRSATDRAASDWSAMKPLLEAPAP